MEITTKLRALIAVCMTGLLLLTLATALASKSPMVKRRAVEQGAMHCPIH